MAACMHLLAGSVSLRFSGQMRIELFTRQLAFDGAENACNRLGGHLVSLASLDEDLALRVQVQAAADALGINRCAPQLLRAE